MQDITYSGSALNGTLDNPNATLAQPLHVGDDSAIVAGELTGWPNGADHKLFVIEVDTERDAEERILCSQISGAGPATFTIVQRGFDGTAESEHAIAATVFHVLDAGTVAELVQHVVDASRDDHGQYLTTGRHDTTERHTFGDAEALGTPGAPADVGTTAGVGLAETPARWDHVHELGEASIDDPALFGATVIPEPAFEDGSVSTRVLGDGSVTADKISAGIAPIAAADSTVAGDDIPVGTSTPVWLQPDRDRLYAWIGSRWRWRVGKAIKCALSYHVDGNNIAADLPSWHDLNQFTNDADEFSMASAGGTITIPTDILGPPAYAFDGEWDVIWRILVSSLGATPGAVELQLLTNTATFLLNSGPSSPGHSTMLEGRLTVPLLAAATAKLQLTQAGAGVVHVASGSTYELRYRGPV